MKTKKNTLQILTIITIMMSFMFITIQSIAVEKSSLELQLQYFRKINRRY